ncbi:GlcG/HbpS family heme-binding protein [Stutzerimonas azotifigens]|uniref:Heme-binding protein n=1 Tax=Stutzerimonas azotifigens TaxID=291995 RepID=A0ABR5Z2A3_9GAMM|nr:heme-binding protein [Stutzerimonas azotifigens]MBA1274334.1 heme-binding protein [Stutzerimonas azotifigens]
MKRLEYDCMTLELAEKLAQKIIIAASEQILEVACAVVDASGLTVLHVRMDGAFPAALDAALAKARCAALYRRDTSQFAIRVREGVPLNCLPHVVPLGGGVTLFGRDGTVLGAVGVSGAIEEIETSLVERVVSVFLR